MLHILYGIKYGNCTGPTYIKLTKVIISVRVQGQWWNEETEWGMVIKDEFIYNTICLLKRQKVLIYYLLHFLKSVHIDRKLEANTYNC